jgi:hypothetical protein
MKKTKKVLFIFCLSLVLVIGSGVLLSIATNPRESQRLPKAHFIRVAADMNNVPSEDLVFLDSSPKYLPLTGYAVHRAKIYNTKRDEIYSVTLDAWSQAVNYERIKEEEKKAFFQKYGKLTPKLYSYLQSDWLTGNIPVAIWLNIDANRLPTRGINRDSAMADLRELIADTVEDLEVELISREITVDYVSTLAPLIYAQVPVADLATDGWLQAREDVNAIYDAMNVCEDHLEYQTKSARIPKVWNQGITGTGVKVAIIEDSRVDFENTCLTNNSGTRVPADSNVDDHATTTAGMVGSSHSTYRGAAYNASIRSSNATDYSDPNLAAALDDGAQLANVLNNSWGSTLPDGTMSVHSRHADWIVRNAARVVVGSAGNTGNVTGYEYVSQVAAGYNTIAVGSYNNNHTGLWSDDIISSFSSYKDPISQGHEKPEVAAPGEDPSTGYSGWQSYGIYSLNMVQPASYCGLGGVGNGTSYAAPIVSGIAALMMHANIVMKFWPEVIKAAIMCSAINNIEGASRVSDKDGAGGVSAKKGIKIIRRNDLAYGLINDEVVARHPWIYIPIAPMTETGRKYRIVLCWDSNPDATYTIDPLTFDLDVTLLINGLIKAASASTDNPFEIIEYTPSASDIPTTSAFIRITITSGSGSTYYGVAWGKYDT